MKLADLSTQLEVVALLLRLVPKPPYVSGYGLGFNGYTYLRLIIIVMMIIAETITMIHTAEDIPADIAIILSSPPAAAGTLVLLLLLSAVRICKFD